MSKNSNQIYETIDNFIEAYKDGNFPHGRVGVDFEVFKYVNNLDSKDRHKYLKYYFQKAKK